MSGEARHFFFKVPASSGNLGPGFDCLGLAVSLYLQGSLTITEKDQFECHIVNSGRDSGQLSNNYKHHLVAQVFFQLHPHQGKNEYVFEINNGIPLGKGLGSSGAAVVAGVILARAVMGIKTETLNERVEAYLQAFKIENNPDNVGPSIVGGLACCCGDHFVVPYQYDIVYKPFAMVPDMTLSTEYSRKQLPPSYSKEDAVFNIQRATLVPIALTNHSVDLKKAMEDRIHQPYRLKLLPEELQAFLKSAKLPACISGAGPSVLVFSAPEDVDQTALTLRAVSDRVEVLALEVDKHGCQVEEIS